MAKNPNTLTQTELRQLRDELMPLCDTISDLRRKMDRAEEGLALLALPEDEVPAWKRGQLAFHHDMRERYEKHIAELPAQIRDACNTANAASAPAWRHIAAHDDARWAELAENPPKILRGEGSVLVAHLATLATKNVRPEFCRQLVKQLVRKNAERTLAPGYQMSICTLVTTAKVTHVVAWAEAHPGQLPRLMKDNDYRRVLEETRAWVGREKIKAELKGAGQPLDSIDAGQLRLMNSEHFAALGKYLNCCIGSAAVYARRADTKQRAYVGVYDIRTDLPIGLVEVRPERPALVLGEVQGLKSRDVTYQDQLKAWVAHPTTRAQLSAALGFAEDEHEVNVGAQCDRHSAWTSNGALQWANAVRFTVDIAADQVASGEADARVAFDLAWTYGGPSTFADLKGQVLTQWGQSDDRATQLTTQRWTAYLEKFEQVRSAQDELFELDRQLV